jgi:hypothetical protein
MLSPGEPVKTLGIATVRAALAELDDTDRDALLLRYFEQKSAQEMGGILGVSAEAAQKRASRAMEQLRGLFAKRGVALSAGALALLHALADRDEGEILAVVTNRKSRAAG